MTLSHNMPQLVDHFAPGSSAFRIELYEGEAMTGSLNASPSLVREHEIDLDGIWAAESDGNRGGLLIARWILNGYEYGYDTAHMTTSSPCMLRAFGRVFGKRPFHAYAYHRGGDEKQLPELTADGAVDLLSSYAAKAEEGSAFARHKLTEGISARIPLSDELVLLHAKRVTESQP